MGRPSMLPPVANSVRHLKAEALHTLEAMQSGRIPWAMGEACLQILRAETGQILDRNLARLRGEPDPWPQNEPVERTLKPAYLCCRRPYWRPDTPRRLYRWRQWPPPHLVARYPHRFKNPAADEAELLDALSEPEVS